MLWKEIKSWAKERGYEAKKCSEGYSWNLISNPETSGNSPSVSKLARDIFNNMTHNKFIEHQKNYKENFNGTIEEKEC